MEKRMIIAIALSLLVLVSFQVIAPREQRVTPIDEMSYDKKPDKQAALPSRETAKRETTLDPREEKTTLIQTAKHDLVFSDKGGSLKKISLRQVDQDVLTEDLYEQEDPGNRIFALRTPFLEGLDTAYYTIDQKRRQIVYTYTEPTWLEISKTYTFPENSYAIKVKIGIKNLTGRRIDLPYSLVGPGGILRVSQVSGRNFVEAATLVDGKVWKVSKPKGRQERSGIIGWTAVKNRYFAMVLKPFDSVNSVSVRDLGNQEPITEFNISKVSLSPDQEKTREYVFYAGPLSIEPLSEVSEDLISVIDYGFFGGVSKGLLSVLRFFHTWTKNWGVSIILLTLLINIVLFPLAMKSFASMHQMKKIQPHIQKLKDLHKDNPQKLNKETMELYKKYNVNPLGGCLPLLLQMPIFIALYQGLIRSVELKGAGFLWIKDLSLPDAVPIPFSLPLVGNSLNILPLLMVVMMVVQQRITQGASAAGLSKEQEGQQKIMMMAMPLIFGFMFYNMPSGLVLYWLMNTVIMSLGQGLISRRMAD